MGVLLAFEDAVDIGYGRGRLAEPAAASLRRVDSAFGRAADINEAWRSPQQADANYAAYQAYLNGGPWAPIGLAAKDSIHCRGYAVDTDDTSDAQMQVWNDHGWFWTVYRNGVLVERWHLEYDVTRDNHRYETASTGSTPFESPTIPPEDDDMLALKITANGTEHLCTLAPGVFRHLIAGDNPEKVKNVIRSADDWTTLDWSELNIYLRTYGVDLEAWRLTDDGQFQVLDPLTGEYGAGRVWTAENARYADLKKILTK